MPIDPAKLDALTQTASLEFGLAVNRIAADYLKKRKEALAGASIGQLGAREAITQELQLAQSREMCESLAKIWLGLLEGTNGGVLTREDANYIKARVLECTAARKSSLMSQHGIASTRPNITAIRQNVARQMDIAASEICNTVELRFRKQELGLPKGATMERVTNVTIHNAANVNLGSQVGTINASLSVITEQGQTEVATAITKLTEAVLKSTEVQEEQKQQTLDVIAELARQAQLKPETRSSGIVKALLSSAPTVIGLTADLTALWITYGPVLERFFALR